MGYDISIQDAIEVNFSCPHGMPERKMGAAVGQDCVLLEEVCGWINAKATIPVWAKMTPNITDITQVQSFSLFFLLHCPSLDRFFAIAGIFGLTSGLTINRQRAVYR